MSDPDYSAMRRCGNSQCEIRLSKHDIDNFIIGREAVYVVVCSRECSRIVATALEAKAEQITELTTKLSRYEEMASGLILA